MLMGNPYTQIHPRFRYPREAIDPDSDSIFSCIWKIIDKNRSSGDIRARCAEPGRIVQRDPAFLLRRTGSTTGARTSA